MKSYYRDETRFERAFYTVAAYIVMIAFLIGIIGLSIAAIVATALAVIAIVN